MEETQNPPHPFEFDLTQLREKVGRDGRCARLVKAIQIAEAHKAVEVDLRMAWSCLELLARSMPTPGEEPGPHDDDTGLILQALMTNAVMLYCRALVSKSSSGRFNVGATSAYSNDQRRWHKQVAHLRDKVLAHYGEGDGLELGPWMRARLLVSLESVDFQFQSINAQAELCTALSSLIVSALDWLEGQAPAWQERLATELLALVRNHRDLAEALGATQFEHSQWFVGPRPERNTFTHLVARPEDGRLPR